MAIEPLSTSPAAFAPLAAKINELVEAIRPLLNIEGQNGIKVNYFDNNISIEIPQDIDGYGGGTGGGLPDGYGPEEWTVYDGGAVTVRNFITDNPD